MVSDSQPITFDHATLIYGGTLKTTRIQLRRYSKEATRLLAHLQQLVTSLDPPSFFKNAHCTTCDFRASCLSVLTEQDHLSLLGGMNEKHILKLNNRGIFTVHQLSYTFKPRKRRAASAPRCKTDFALKALALREQRTYIKELPHLQEQGKE